MNFIFTIFKSGYPNQNDVKKYYKLNFNDEPIPVIINEYLLGLNWVLNYYFNNIVDKTWYYSYGKSPLLYDIINNYNSNILKLQRKDKFKDDDFLTPLEQVIFITPIDLNQNITDQIQLVNKVLTFDDILKLTKFIKDHNQYFFNLQKIFKQLYDKDKKLIDCSTSIFVNKCHLIFLERDIDLTKFIKDFRKVFPLSYQKKILNL